MIEPIDPKLDAHYRSLMLEGESVEFQLHGAFKEALICTTHRVLILKTGFMTGNTFGVNVFQALYASITGVQVHRGMLGGYFEISTPSMQNTQKVYLSSEAETDAKQAPNCVSTAGVIMAESFQEAANYILSRQQPPTAPKASFAELIESLAKLRDQGLLSDEEFAAKKAELLSRL